MQRSFVCLLLFILCAQQAIHAQSALPDFQRFKKPSGVSAPGEAFTPTTSGSATSNAPEVAEWTRTAGPDQSIVLTGSNLSRFSGNEEGKDTRFRVYAAGGFQKDASIQRLDQDKAVITLPSEIGRWGMYLIWPANDNGFGKPMAINKTDLWWVGPDRAPRGTVASVFGRNLANQNGTTVSHVYLRSASGAGQWAEITKVNPYRVDFRVPTNLANGEYEVWVHNGHGGEYGWGGPGKIVLTDAPQWTSKIINIKDFGAKGDGVTDDFPAIDKAVYESYKNPGSKVYFPAGVYMISKSLGIEQFTRWQGDGIDKTIIKCASNYSSESYGILFAGGKGNFEMEGMTFDANNNMRGYLTKAIYFRGSADVKINNVKFVCPQNDIFDLHKATRVTITNSEVIGMISFLGSGTHIFIDNCLFKQTNNSTTAIYQWGGHNVSVTNSTCQDLDNSNPNSLAGWGTGRFFTGDGNWGSNWNTYLANNTGKDLTVSPIAHDQNCGEIFMWEGTYNDYMGTVSSSTESRTTLNGFALTNSSPRYAVVVKGKGFGQSRRIVGYEGNSIVLEEPWNVTPDNSSMIAVGRFLDRVVVYNNYLDGKPRAVSSASHIAAAGIQPFSGTFNFIADNNTLHELRQGTANWAMSVGGGKVEPNYFSLYSNNKYINCREGILNVSNVSNPEAVSIFGAMYRNNLIQNPRLNAISNEVTNVDVPLVSTIMYEHNKVQQAPVAFSIRALINRSWVNGINNQILYKNDMGGNGWGSAIVTAKGMGFRDNVYNGFTRRYSADLISNNTVEGPNRVILMNATPNGSSVTTPLTVWNSGSASMNWSIAGNPAWLALSLTNGVLEHEGQNATVQLTANPVGLAAGTHKAFLTVTASGRTITYTVLFQIGTEQTVQPQPAQVNLTSPTQNASYVEAQPIPVNASVIATEPVEKVEFFQDNLKVGEALSAPYTMQLNNLRPGQYKILAKAVSKGAFIATSEAVNVSVQARTNVAPSVSLTSPAATTAFTAPAAVNINATAQDSDGSITKVEFFQGSVKLGEDLTAPYTFSWQSVAAGNYSITARATDNSGAVTTSAAVLINVNAPANQPPTVRITAPAANASFTAPAAIRITADATDADGSITKVEFFQGSVKLGEDLTAPFEFSWQGVAAGNYSITARATDNRGGATTSAAVTANVSSPANQLPTVRITSPINGSTHNAGASITVTADARDADGTISRVRFFRGSTLVSEDVTSPYTATVSNVPVGSYALTAVAIDNREASVTSQVVTITVRNAVASSTSSSTVTCPGTGSITWEYLLDVPWGFSLEAERTYTGPPNGIRSLSSFSAPRNFAENYGGRIRGYICPPVSGNYIFHLSADDIAELWLSTDATMGNSRRIASVASWTSFAQYNKFGSQRSGSVYLEAGRRYFIQAVHIENRGDDHLSVAWTLPNGTLQAPIQGQHLMPFVSEARTSIAQNKAGEFALQENNLATAKTSFLDVAPNPVQSAATLRFQVTETAQTVVELYNAQGALVRRLFNGLTDKGQVYQVSLNSSNLPGGVYYCKLVSGATILQKQIVVAR